MEYVLSCAEIATMPALHQEIARVLGFPPYYGANLSALYDCMTDLPPISLRIVHSALLVKNLGENGRRFLQVLEAATVENNNIQLILA